MKSLSAINFALPVRAERHGHSLRTAIENFSIYNINHITPGEHDMKNIMGQPLNQLVCNMAYSSGKGASSCGKYKKRLTINIVSWIFSQLVFDRPSSSGKAPAHIGKEQK